MQSDAKPAAHDEAHLRQWIGRREHAQDIMTARHARCVAATLDLAVDDWNDGAALPPLWHWTLFPPLYATGAAGADGHAERGGFLPPVALPFRVWAGSQLQFGPALRVGDSVRRDSEIVDVRLRIGRSGALCLITVRHRIARLESDGRAAAVAAVTEDQTIAYRSSPAGAAAASAVTAPPAADLVQGFEPSPLLLFRYSALTFNGHLIHYDRAYCSGHGYPDLLVHGPLQATLAAGCMAQLQPQATLRTLSVKALAPLFAGQSCRCAAARAADGRLDGWVMDSQGRVTMQLAATAAPA